MRVATWNMKQADAPKAKLPTLWDWAAEEIAPDVAVFTEAKVPKEGVPEGWSALWIEGGIGLRRRWGTVIAGRGVSLIEVQEVQTIRGKRSLSSTWPAIVQVADVLVRGERWATVVGMYGILEDEAGVKRGNGGRSARVILQELEPLLSSSRGERLIVAGDLNLWPMDVPTQFGEVGLIDLINATVDERPPLDGCSGCGLGPRCGHMWTHANPGGKNPSRQQIDFIFATSGLYQDLKSVSGGIRDFPAAWSVSDHAPVVADFI